MKRVLLLLVFLSAFLSLAASAPADTLTAAQLKAILRENPEMAGNNHFVPATYPSEATPAPKGYKPVYISHYGRHGARYVTSAEKYDDVMALLDRGRAEGLLTEKGEALYQKYSALYPMLKDHEGDLTVIGQEQHRELARQMVAAYPSVFGKKPVVDARASISPRAIISMMSFCDELRQLRPGLRLTYGADHTDLPVTALAPAGADAKAEEEYKAIFKTPYLSNGFGRGARAIGFHLDAFFLRYFKSMDPVKESGEPLDLFSTLGEVAYNLQCLETDVRMDDLFTEEELFQFWEYSNLWGVLMFTDTPYTRGAISARAWSLLDDIIRKADEDIASGAVQARLRFGHDSVVAPLMDLLGIEGWEPLGEDASRWKYHFQSWNVPMASNVQMIFYKGRQGDILVRVMYNGKDQVLPLEDQHLAPYYRWEDFENHYRPVVERAAAVTQGFREGNPVVTVQEGALQGVKADGVLIYKGVPFAAPPVGELRGKAPQPARPWEGILQADHFPPAAIQDPFPKDDPVYYKEFYADGDPEFSEDCLYLNVWAPASTVGRPESKAPVAVWIHGGAFSHGYSYEMERDGEEWARRGVILVTIPYRLGELGFGADGFLGFQDQIAALRWVRDNIAAFGGDPSNVTIVGQSAGAISCKYLFTYPEAAPLFHKAIFHSGGGLNLMDNPPILPKGLCGEPLPAAVENGLFDKKPILMGWVAQDPAFLGKPVTEEFASVLAARGNGNVYVYAFNRNLPEPEGYPDWGAYHTFELWYSFGTLGRSWRPFTEADYDLSRRMIDDWTAFIRSGNPGWAPADAQDPHTQVFDIE